jgi:two-component system sensor histidine kinase ChiS
MDLLRERLQYIEDLSHIEKDFAGAIELILFGRYSTAGRKMILISEGVDTCEDPSCINILQDLLAMIMELANNDLKYGQGSTRWELRKDGEQLSILMEAETGYDFSKNSLGRGTALLRERSSRMGGNMHMDIKDGCFRFDLVIPVCCSDQTV